MIFVPIPCYKLCYVSVLQPFPTGKNGFKVGMKLEGIDPKHPSLYCVISVAEVRGYRVRLHFDGYSECYDFWTYANSPNIFPGGWTEKNGKRLQPPKGNYFWLIVHLLCMNCVICFLQSNYFYLRET